MQGAFEWLRGFVLRTPQFTTSQDRDHRKTMTEQLDICAFKVGKAVLESPTLAKTLQNCFEHGGEPFDVAYLLWFATENSSGDVSSILTRAGFKRKKLQTMAKHISEVANDIEKFNSPLLPGLWSYVDLTGAHERAEVLHELPRLLRSYAEEVESWPPADWKFLSARNYEAVYLHLYLEAFGGIGWDDFEALLAFADYIRGREVDTKEEAARKRLHRFFVGNAELYEDMKRDMQQYVLRNRLLQQHGKDRTMYFPHVRDEILS